MNSWLRNTLIAAIACASIAAQAQTYPTTPEKFGNLIRAEIANWSKVIREAGVKLEQ